MFLTYDGELSEVGYPERRRDGYVGGIAAGCHEHSPQPRMIVTRVKGPPTVFEVRFKPGTEVHRIRRGGNSDVAQISGGIACGNIQSATHRHRKMLEIATDAEAFGKHV